MSDADSFALLAHLDAALAGLEQLSSRDVAESPELGSRLSRIAELMADLDLLLADGYYTLEQAYGKICNMFRAGAVSRIKTFTHCGREHPYQVLQTYVTCPECREHRAKTRGLFANDEIEDVAYLTLLWLRIDPRAIPGWNPACESRRPGESA